MEKRDYYEVLGVQRDADAAAMNADGALRPRASREAHEVSAGAADAVGPIPPLDRLDTAVTSAITSTVKATC